MTGRRRSRWPANGQCDAKPQRGPRAPGFACRVPALGGCEARGRARVAVHVLPVCLRTRLAPSKIRCGGGCEWKAELAKASGSGGVAAWDERDCWYPGQMGFPFLRSALAIGGTKRRLQQHIPRGRCQGMESSTSIPKAEPAQWQARECNALCRASRNALHRHRVSELLKVKTILVGHRPVTHRVCLL